MLACIYTSILFLTWIKQKFYFTISVYIGVFLFVIKISLRKWCALIRLEHALFYLALLTRITPRHYAYNLQQLIFVHALSARDNIFSMQFFKPGFAVTWKTCD